MEGREGSPRQGQLDSHSAAPLDSPFIPDPAMWTEKLRDPRLEEGWGPGGRFRTPTHWP